MTLGSRKFDRKETDTVFRHARNRRIFCRLDVRLYTDDGNRLQGITGQMYKASVSEGGKTEREGNAGSAGV